MVSFDSFLPQLLFSPLECLVSYSFVINSIIGTTCDVSSFDFLDSVWLLIGWFSKPRDEIEIVAAVATVVAYDGSIPNSIINQSINQFP